MNIHSMVVCCLVLAGVFCAGAGEAQPRALRVGEVRVQADAGNASAASQALRRELSQLLSRELKAVHSSGPQTYVLSAALLELRSRKRGRQFETSCVVSGVLRDADGGTIRALLKGKARVHDQGELDPASRRLALEAATRRLISGVPGALAASK